jgi:multidrug efflux pump subunit AcrB
MNGAIAWFTRNPVASNLTMIVIIVAGLVTMPTITQELIPNIELEIVTVTVPYPGASPREVEASITTRLEDELQGLQGIKRMRSTSAEGVSVVTVELLAGEDVRQHLDDFRSAVDAIDTFPDDAEEAIVKQVEITRQVLNVAISGEADEWTLKRLGQQVRDEIVALPGITDAELSLARPYEISIEVSEESLHRHGFSFDDVVRAVRSSSLDLPGGSIKTAGGEILLRAKGQAYSGADFENIALVSKRDGTRLSLGDVATVVDGFAESDQSARFDGTPAVMVQVFRVGDQKSLSVSETVREYIAEAEARMPEGIALTVWKDDSLVLRDRLDTMLRNARGGFVLVVLILACFLRLRLALWVSLGIPISFLGAVALMPHMGVSVNFVSLLGFIVVLGIVVDDAIVVGENTHTYQERTGDKIRGAILGAQTLVVPVTFGVLTTIAAFVPMLFLPGPMGRMSRVVPIIVILCLLFSLFESMMILPSHLAHGKNALDKQPSNRVSRRWKRFQDRVAKGLAYVIEDLYRPTLRSALEWRYLTATIALGLLMITIGIPAGGHLRFIFQETVEADFIVADLTMAQGTPAFQTARAISRMEQALEEVVAEIDAESDSDRPSIISHVLASISDQPHRMRHENGPMGGRRGVSAGNIGEIQVDVVSYQERDVGVSEITRRWREKVGDIPGATELTFLSTLISVGSPIEIELSGTDLDALRDAAEDVKHALSAYPGVFDIADSFRGGKQELEYQIKPSAEALGLTLADLARQLRQGFYGDEVQSLQRGRDEVKVIVRYPARDRRSLSDVEDMRIRSADGTEVPFSRVAEVSLSTGYSSIKHVDRRRVVTVTADVDQSVANANEIVAHLRRGALDEVLMQHHGILFSFEGEQAEQRDFLRAQLIGLAISLLVIYTLLAVPLGSYVQPILIMSAIPFGLVGAIWGHVILGYKLSMYSVIGLIALAGVVVNASLVLVDAVNKRLADGDDLHTALMTAASTRFRPIMLTSMTTFAGLTPMMLETSMQAQFMIPMAISIAFGVGFASLITLLLVPCSYLILEDFFMLIGRDDATQITAGQLVRLGEKKRNLGPERPQNIAS